jgi:probable rRNA maturation factor
MQAHDPAARADAMPQQAVILDLQDARRDETAGVVLPTLADLERWASAALEAGLTQRARNIPYPAELTLRITDEAESAELNQRYRQRSGPTNVLSFPFEPPAEVDMTDPQAAPLAAFLGDLVLCAPLVASEAATQHKTETAHWAHLLVHGVLHLLGFDHLSADEATLMETLEVQTLEALGFPSPYEVHDDVHDE